MTSPNTDPSQSNLFMATTCTNAWSCWAVGGVIPSLGGNSQPNALIDSWNGSTWSIESAVGPPGTDASLLWSVTCVVASDCWAVGAQEPTGNQSPQTLAEHWDGSTWSVVPTPAVNGYLFSVTCSASANCWAVGDSVDGQGNPLNGIIYRWDGSQWSQVGAPSSGQTYDQFESVTCSNDSDCWAVGTAGPNQIQYNFLPGIAPNVVGASALIEHWDGKAWSVASNSPPGSGQYLTAVTCTQSTDCWTVGSSMDSNGNPSSSLRRALGWVDMDAEHRPRSDDACEYLDLGHVPYELSVLGNRSDKFGQWPERDADAVHRKLERHQLVGSAQPERHGVWLPRRNELCAGQRLLRSRLLGQQPEQQHHAADSYRAAHNPAGPRAGIVDDRDRRRGVLLRECKLPWLDRRHGAQQAHRGNGSDARRWWVLVGGL